MFSVAAFAKDVCIKAILRLHKCREWYKYACLYVVCRVFPHIVEIDGRNAGEEIQLNDIIDVSITPHLNERCIIVPESEFIGLISSLYMDCTLSVGALCMLLSLTEGHQVHGKTSESMTELTIMLTSGKTKTFDGTHFVKFV